MREVGEYFGKSVWSINSIMKRNSVSRRLASKTREIQFKKTPLSYEPKIFLTKKEERLKTVGLVLYWGEGAKKNKNGQINFTNSDSVMIKIFVSFLRSIYCINESKLRCHLYCFESQNIQSEINYWANITSIPAKQFIKPYIATNKTPSHAKITHGVCHIVYSDKRLFDLIMADMYTLIDNMNC